jgi:hypothetical protein
MNSVTRCCFTAHLGLECLEPRLALAGNIAASLVGDTLHLTGDRLDNDAIVTVQDGFVHVGSIKNTTINGAASLSLSVDPTRLNLVIDGAAGNDQLWINVNTAQMAADLIIRGGDGNDNLAVVPTSTGNARLLGSVSIDAGKGDDVVDVGIGISGNLSIIGGVGSDQVHVRGTSVAGNLHIASGDGNDRVSIAAGTSVGGALNFDGGKGRDLIALPSYVAADAVFAAFEDIRLL